MICQHPTVSVIVPTYNRAQWIGRCIESVLSQHWDDFELIIIDDGSTDDTDNAVGRFEDARIVYGKKKNGGQASARNLGIQMSRGAYIALCDDDDLFYPHHLETLVACLERRARIGLVYSDALWRYEDEKASPEVRFSQDFDKKQLENFNYITPLNVVFRRSCLRETVLFDENPAVRGLEDWLFFLRLSDLHPFYHIKETTAEYSVHLGNSFQKGSGYDYHRAFLTVRMNRLEFLISQHGPDLFDHVDHMYPFHLVQCFLNNGKLNEAHQIAVDLLGLYDRYDSSREKAPYTELLISFSFGLTMFALGQNGKAISVFESLKNNPSYPSIRTEFVRFIGDYAGRTPNQALKHCLGTYFDEEEKDGRNQEALYGQGWEGKIVGGGKSSLKWAPRL